jgi:hypothetical protein
MAQGSKASDTSKQKRQAQHIKDSEKKLGKRTKTAARMAWATVNKETGGAGKKKVSSPIGASTSRSMYTHH